MTYLRGIQPLICLMTVTAPKKVRKWVLKRTSTDMEMRVHLRNRNVRSGQEVIKEILGPFSRVFDHLNREACDKGIAQISNSFGLIFMAAEKGKPMDRIEIAISLRVASFTRQGQASKTTEKERQSRILLRRPPQRQVHSLHTPCFRLTRNGTSTHSPHSWKP